MKIMIITPYFYPRIGGLENYALNTAKGLQKLGHEVFVVTSNHEGNVISEDTIQGMKIIRLPRLFKISNTPINPIWYFQLKKIIKKENPEIINAHTPVPFIADIAERVSGKRIFVLTYHNDLVKESAFANLLAHTYNFIFTRKTLRRCDAIIATSKYYVDISPYLAKHKKKIKIVPPGIDTKRFNTNVDSGWLNKNYPNKIIILYVGSMQKTHMHKGVDILIKAVADAKKKIPNIYLIAVGSGDAIPVYKKIAHQMGISEMVSFPGFIDDESLPKYYAGANMLVLPTTTNAEGFGMVLAEAMACGVPVIGTEVGGVPYLLTDKATALLIPPNNVASLSKAIVKNSLGFRGLQKKEVADSVSDDFDWSKIAQKYDRIMNALHNKYNVFQIAPYYPPHLGGLENVVKNISEIIVKQGHNVTVVTSDIGSSNEVEPKAQVPIKIKRLHAHEFAHQPFFLSRLFLYLIKSPRRSIFHVHIAQPFVPEIAFLVAKIKRAHFISHFHLDVEPSGRLGFIFSAYKKTLLPFVLKRSDKVIAFSQGQADLIQERYGVNESRLVVIPNGVGQEYFSDRIRKPHKPTKLLYVGRLNKQKNVKLLLKALQSNSQNFITNIVGEGELENDLKSFVKESKLKNIKFKGRLSGQRLLNIYRESDIFVLTSKREGMPLVVLEAMAMGLPCIATNVIGTKDLITDKQTGILIKDNDHIDLMQKISKLSGDIEFYRKISTNSFNYSKNFRWLEIGRKIDDVYGILVHGE
jgi:glycosyltransferase involved in cell wall biosynthesis